MNSKLVLLLAAGAILPVAASSRLPLVSLQEFLAAAPCGVLVEVETIKRDADYLIKFEEAVARGESPEIMPDIEALLRVEYSFGDELSCGTEEEVPTGVFSMLFFSAAHSAHPKAGERAIVFPSPRAGQWWEAVYGRSYWRIRGGVELSVIEIDWRNLFLAEGLEVVCDESNIIGHVNLAELTALWKSPGGFLKKSPAQNCALEKIESQMEELEWEQGRILEELDPERQ